MKIAVVILAVAFTLLNLTMLQARADMNLSDWDSVGELQTFLEEDTPVITLELGKTFPKYMCWPLACGLRDRAEAQGKRLETELLDYYEYHHWYGEYLKSIDDYHAINKALVGKKMYFVDPMTDRIWKVANIR